MQALCIGNFEGVHRGHAELLAAARRLAGPQGRVASVAFEPLPVEVLRPGTLQGRLGTPQSKVERLRALGADAVHLLPTDRDLLSLEPEVFIRMLRERVPFDVVVEGPDFRFGRGRRGDVALLAALGAQEGFRVEVVPELDVALSDGCLVPARSRLVRWLLGHGRVRDAAAVLGRPYLLEGTVVPGDRQGRLLGCPTANLDHGSLLLPGDGVYAGWARLADGSRVAAAISVGRKPTFVPTPPRCEVHLIDRELPLDHYGWSIAVEFHRWIRGQLVFPGVAPLVEQMQRDVDRIREVLALEPSPFALAGTA